MAEQSGFFDAHLVNGSYDRVYLADNFAKYFASFIGNGIFGGKSNELMVRQKSIADMSVRVLSGQGWINGYWYENTNEVSLDISVADGVLNRIDLIVLRWDNSERVIRLAVKRGTPASSPTAPSLQRSADYYELKLAEVNVAAGTTKITQANILDTRLNSSVCGLVHAVVDQLDTTELGAQLDTYISEFIVKNNNWFNQFTTNSNTSVNTLLNTNQARIDEFLGNAETDINATVTQYQTDLEALKTAGNESINELINTKTTEINTLITDSQAEIDALIEDLEQALADSDVTAINNKIAEVVERVVTLESDVATLKADVEKLKLIAVESEDNAGCYYRTVNEEVEWINPPNLFDTEYKTTERWNGEPVYQKITYIAALSNKTAMSIHVNAAFDRIISITGFAVDSDNNMHYPFPIVLNGLEPIAVISYAEGDGGTGSDITINVNEDLSTFKAYVTVKYTKATEE